MKKIFVSATTLALALLVCLSIQARIITLPKNNDGGWYYPKGGHGILPGDTVRMTGDYAYVNLDGVNGTASKPVVFITDGKLVRAGIRNSYGFIITHSHYFKMDGRIAGGGYGFKIGGPNGEFISQSLGFAWSDNFEMVGLELTNSQVGFFSNPKSGGPFRNILIHDCYIHGLNNPAEAGRSEAFYIGYTGTAVASDSVRFENVQIYDNRLEALYGDGIQIALTKGVQILRNTITVYGKANLEQQRTAIIVGGCTEGTVADNIITDGTGAAIQVFGGGPIYIQRNKITNAARSANEDGIYISAKCTGVPAQVHLVGNSIDTAARDLWRDASGSVVENVNNSWNEIIPPIPPKVIVAQGFFSSAAGVKVYYTLYSDGTWKQSW